MADTKRPNPRQKGGASGYATMTHGKTVEGKVAGPMPDKKVKGQVSGHINWAEPEKDAAGMKKHYEKGPKRQGHKK